MIAFRARTSDGARCLVRRAVLAWHHQTRSGVAVAAGTSKSGKQGPARCGGRLQACPG